MLSGRKCIDCGKDISERGWRAVRCIECYKIFRRKYHRELYHANIQHYREYARLRRKQPNVREAVKSENKRYYEKHREKRLATSREYYRRKTRKLWEDWGISNGEAGELAEKIAPRILETEGFKDVFHPPAIFAFDYLAKKNGQIHFIEVTSGFKKTLKKPQIELANYFGFPIMILFIKPDLTKYRLVLPKFRNVCVITKKSDAPLKEILNDIRRSAG
jgi:hypothetical protein